jgi:Sulfotransferase domain
MEKELLRLSEGEDSRSDQARRDTSSNDSKIDDLLKHFRQFHDQQQNSSTSDSQMQGPNDRPEIEEAFDREPTGATSFSKLQELVSRGRLSIKLILAPPRTGSTLTEISFARNSQIDAHVHEPFKHPPEVAYSMIYDRVKSSVSSERLYAEDLFQFLDQFYTRSVFESSHTASDDPVRSMNIVVKDMSHRLETSDEHERLFSLIESPVIFLIRNPLLTTESEIRGELGPLYSKEKPDVQETLLNYYAQTKGEREWNDLLNKYEHIPDAAVADKVVSWYRTNQRIAVLEEKGDVEQVTLQQWLLDYYARTKGYERWKVMLEEGFVDRNYKLFGDLLQNRSKTALAWKATEGYLSYLERQGKQAVIVDNTDYRLDPETVIPVLCKQWGVPYSEDMVNWGDKSLRSYMGHAKLDRSRWYDKLRKSCGIKPPSEVSPVLEDFPDFIADHLVNVDLPPYIRMFNHPSRVKLDKSVSGKKVSVPVNREVHKRLRDMGVLPCTMDLKHRTDLDPEVFEILSAEGRLQYDHGKATIMLSMEEIDPVFAYISNPEVRNDEQFNRVNRRYLQTLSAIDKIGK